jgi:hypothetical protein
MAGPLTGASPSAVAPFVNAPFRKATPPAVSPTAMIIPTNAKRTRHRSARQNDNAATRRAAPVRAVWRAAMPAAPTMAAVLRHARRTCPPAAPKVSVVVRHVRWARPPAAPKTSVALRHACWARPPATRKTSVALRQAPATDGRSQAMISRRVRRGGDAGSSSKHGASPTGWGSSGGAAAKKLRSTSVHGASSEGFPRSPMKVVSREPACTAQIHGTAFQFAADSCALRQDCDESRARSSCRNRCGPCRSRPRRSRR